MKQFLRNNALSLAALGLFSIATIGQLVAGLSAYNGERAEQGRVLVGLAEYLTTGHFIEALFENWESEFLQMGVYIGLCARLRQQGSAESKPIGEPFDGDEDPRRHCTDPSAPWPVRRGGVVLWLYERSLVLAFCLLFLVSLAMHAVGGRLKENEERAQHALPEESVLEFVESSQFWFESFQNWQSEFLSVFSIVTLTIFLRQRGSPQSKPVHSASSHTGK